MRNIRLLLAFDGTNYAGWQRQKNATTLQGVIEEAIRTMTSEDVVLHGAGRTDAGVHALGMVANFQTDSSIPAAGFGKGLNSILPEDVRILEAQEVSPEFHARKSATGKEYVYHFIVCETLLPTLRLYAAQQRPPFDVERLDDCLGFLVGTKDFSSFEAVGSRDREAEGGRGAVRTIYSAKLTQNDRTGKFEISIAGDGFLRHMVRNIVGTLFDVGKGRLTESAFQEILAARDRSLAGPTAPSKGLFLKQVHY